MPDPCHDCGQCCTQQESPPMYIGYLPGGTMTRVNTDDRRRVRKLPLAVKQELMNYIANMKAGVKPPHPTYPACLWYDAATKRCKHHELRPDICRGFEVGEDACNRYRKGLGLVPLTIGGAP